MKEWHEILAWVKVNKAIFRDAPKFNQGAPSEEIARFVSKFSFLTPDIIDFYREVNGQDFDGHIYDGWAVMSISSSIESYDELYRLNHEDPEGQKLNVRHAIGPVKGMHWNKRWIPFLGSIEGAVYFFDFDPAAEGSLGQIIYAPNDDPARRVVAGSLEEFWLNLKTRLYDGSYTIEDDMIMLDEDE